MGGTHLFQVINEFLSFFFFFLKNLVFVGFGNGLTDKQSLVFGTAFTRNHLAATVYCQALMSLSCQRLPNGELTDFNWRATKTTTSCGKKSNFTYGLECPCLWMQIRCVHAVYIFNVLWHVVALRVLDSH